jgi:hypothetical protein
MYNVTLKCIHVIFIPATLSQEMGWAFGADGGGERCAQVGGGEA